MSAARLGLADFAAELASAAAAVDEWADGVARGAGAAAADHARTMAGLQAQVDALQARRAQVERTVQELEQRLACETDAEAALAADLDAARAEAASLPPQLEKLRAAAADAEAALAARASAADADTAAAQARVRKLEAAVEGYEAATGVTIVSPTDPADTELRIVFARLDAAAPAAVATLGVRVGDGPGAAWTVTRCEPATPRAGALARELASGRLEFAAYVRAMRGEFKGVVGRRGAA